ncbi:unnamed protein product, partial [marine sediment metagenome]
MMLIRTLMTHYRQHPVQALFLLTGIIVANVLLAGTLLINAQARASYQEGEQYLSGTPLGQIHHRNNSQSIDELDYIRLRRLGFDKLAPLLRQIVRGENGQLLELLGIDVFAMPRKSRAMKFGPGTDTANSNFTGFAFPPYQLWVAPARLEQLGAKSTDRIQLASGEMLPPLLAVPGQQLGHRMLMDIGALQSLTGKTGQLSSI